MIGVSKDGHPGHLETTTVARVTNRASVKSMPKALLSAGL